MPLEVVMHRLGRERVAPAGVCNNVLVEHQVAKGYGVSLAPRVAIGYEPADRLLTREAVVECPVDFPASPQAHN